VNSTSIVISEEGYEREKDAVLTSALMCIIAVPRLGDATRGENPSKGPP
jgi:hypothetical protein